MASSRYTSETADKKMDKEQPTDLAQTNSETLQASLHAATRSLHMSLNKSITARLPLCLPPHASDPLSYYTGILMFGEIFVALEAAMEEAHSHSSLRDREILDRLRVPGLARSTRIEHDKKLLEKRLELLPSCGDMDEREGEYVTPEDLVRIAVKDHTACIRKNIRQTPSLAMAYAWTMYLAMFNGGRWLYRTLASAGPNFWLEEQGIADVQALSFWQFDAATQEDPGAETLKLEFKRKFDEASEMLTLEERAEVVAEAKHVFELCSRMVDFLDRHMADQQQQQIARITITTDQTSTVDRTTFLSGSAAMSIWQTVTSKLASLPTPSWSRSWRKEVEVVK